MCRVEGRAARNEDRDVMVIRRRGTTATFLRGLCLTGSLVALGLTGIGAEKSATGGTSVDLDALPVPSRDAASLIVEQRPGEETFRRMCAPCHGETGQGDGPAAAAFDPPPSDFRNPEGLGKLTDEEVAEVITRGRTSMPAFGAILGEEVLPALVAYLRELSSGMDP